MEIHRPDGSLLCSSSGTYTASINCLLDVSGSHTIVAGSTSSTDVGEYGLYLQRTSDPLNATPTSFGQNYTGTLVAGTVEDFTFSGASGERVYVRLAGVSNSLTNPKIEVYRPDGTLLCSAGVTYVSSAVCLLDANGTHTVLAMGQYGNYGPFGLYLQRTSDPLNATPISFGQNYTGTLVVGTVEDFRRTTDPTVRAFIEGRASGLDVSNIMTQQWQVPS